MVKRLLLTLIVGTITVAQGQTVGVWRVLHEANPVTGATQAVMQVFIYPANGSGVRWACDSPPPGEGYGVFFGFQLRQGNYSLSYESGTLTELSTGMVVANFDSPGLVELMAEAEELPIRELGGYQAVRTEVTWELVGDNKIVRVEQKYRLEQRGAQVCRFQL